MMYKRPVWLIALGLALVVLSGYATLELMNSRGFQFFGGITRRVDTRTKVVALTFDDAPTDATGDVLVALDTVGIKATFFAIGWAIERYPDEASEIALAGHELGNHSYSHQRMIFKRPSVIRDEIEKTDSLIRKSGYKGEIFFRPPNGKKLELLPLYLKRHNRRTIMWDVEPETYLAQSAGADAIVDYTVAHVRPGSIILLHPFNQNANTRKAIPGVVAALRTHGYKFVTVSELLSYEGK
jgi:peptidoglycan-N-acetylglucosamine deacetylase